MATEHLRIAIIGAGIGGLTLSAALGVLAKDRPLDVTVYEGASEISEIGAGINFWPRQWKIMQALGLDESLLKFTPSAPVADDFEDLVFQVRKSDQKEGLYVTDMVVKGGTYRFHRADLQDCLMKHMKGKLLLSHRLVSFEEIADEVTLTFANGATATCDLLIGMDGIKSVVRRGLLQSQGVKDSPSTEPIWMGHIAYRGLVPEEALNARFPGHSALDIPMLYSGKNRQIVTYPVKHTTRLINVAAIVTDTSKDRATYTPPPAEVTTDDLVRMFSQFEPQVQALLSCMQKPSEWPMKWLVPLDHYASGRVIVGGDAAHAMPPYQGAGAGVAMEDAYILAHLLNHSSVSRSNVAHVAQVYDVVRTPEGNRVLRDSIACGGISQLRGPGAEDIQAGDASIPRERLQGFFKSFSVYLEWLWRHNADEGREKALEMLEARLKAF